MGRLALVLPLLALLSVADASPSARVVAPSAGVATRPFDETAVLRAPDRASGDQFGWSVALSGDTLLVGAPSDDVSGIENRGSAQLFVRSGTGWAFDRALDLPADVLSAGRSVALDGNLALVGAPFSTIPGSSGPGRVLVFERVGSDWVPRPPVIASDSEGGDAFGLAIAYAAPFLIVGAPFDDTTAADQGSAYVFERSGNDWLPRGKLVDPQGATNDTFGRAVAIHGTRALIGAPQRAAARAFVAEPSGDLWALATSLEAPGTELFDSFGAGVALSIDLALVGAPGDDIAGNQNQGSVAVFERQNGSWAWTTTITAAQGTNLATFGYAVATDGNRMVAGALGATATTFEQGAAHVFDRAGGWSEAGRIVAALPQSRSDFGFAVALGASVIAIGAPLMNLGGDVGGNTGQGAVYVFEERGDGVFASSFESVPATSGMGNVR